MGDVFGIPVPLLLGVPLALLVAADLLTRMVRRRYHGVWRFVDCGAILGLILGCLFSPGMRIFQQARAASANPHLLSAFDRMRLESELPDAALTSFYYVIGGLIAGTLLGLAIALSLGKPIPLAIASTASRGKTREADQRRCPTCRQFVSPGAAFCGNCGSPAFGCPACGVTLEPGSAFCGSCGRQLIAR